MLQNIRDNIQGMMAKIIIAIIVVPFAIFGIQTLFNSSGPVEVATVNGEKITGAELQQAMMARRERLLDMMHDKVPPKMLEESALRGPALDNLISQRLLQQNAAGMGMVMPEQVVDQTILSIPAFQEDGKFSFQRYEALVRSKGYSPASFKQSLQRDMLVSQLQRGVSSSEFVTPKELQRVAGLLRQQRTFDYLTIPLAPLAKKIKPDDKAVEAYYQAHQSQYMNPERVKLSYIELHAKDFAPPLDDKTLKAEYESEIAGMKPTVERHASHILIAVDKHRDAKQAHALAEKIEKKIKTGESFAKLAARYSDDLGSKNSGGDLGTSDGTAFPPLFEHALAKMSAGEVSAPIKTADGFELLKLDSVHTKPLPTFAQKKAKIAQHMMLEKAQPKLLKTVEQLRDLVFNSEGLKGPAAQLKLSVKESGWLARKNDDPLFSNGKIMTAAFSDDVLKDHDNSDVIELAPGHYIVVHVEAHQAAAPKPLASVKDEVVAALKRQRAHAEAEKIAADIEQHLAKGADFEKTAAADGYVFKSVEKVVRHGNGAPPELLRTAFTMPKPVSGKPLPVDTVDAANGDLVLLQLHNVEEGRTDSYSKAQRKALVAQLKNIFGKADFDALQDTLHASAKIERH